MTRRGQFITVEGQDGSGKSTNIETIRETLQSAGIELIETREPGGTPLGEALRTIILEGKELGICDEAELLMVFAARAQHIKQVIEPALKSGKWVLCDRFTDATYAYQGGGRGISLEAISQLEKWVQKDLRPDLTILFDVPVAVGTARANERSEADRFESEANNFKERVRSQYLKLADQYPNRIITINSDQELDLVRTDVIAAVSGFIARVAT